MASIDKRPTCSPGSPVPEHWVSALHRLALNWEALDWDPANRPESDIIEAHDWAHDLAGEIEAGRCPRCNLPITLPGEQASGSFFTDCGCLAICSRCAARERVYEVPERVAWTDQPWFWPVTGGMLDVEATAAEIGGPDDKAGSRSHIRAWKAYYNEEES